MENAPITWNNDELSKFIKQYMPDFFVQVLDPSTDVIVLQNWTLAPNLESAEFMALGAAVKFASIYKKEVRIII